MILLSVFVQQARKFLLLDKELKGNQYVSINGYNSKHLSISLGVPQGSVLGPLLFLIYINDLNTAIKHCKIHHFADDMNLLHINDSIKN